MSEITDVLIVGSNRGTGGIQRYIDQQDEHLSDRVTTRVYDTEVISGNGAVWVLLAILHTVYGALRFPLRRRPDVVHVHTAHWFSFYRASFYVLFSAYVWNVPVVLHVHGSSFDEFLRSHSTVAGLVQAAVFRSCSGVITLSEYWKELVEEHTGAERVYVVPNAVAPEKYSCSPAASVPTIVYVSHLSERKGAADLTTALPDLLERVDDITVHIAGSGPYEDDVDELADRYDSVHYHGYVPEERKRELLADSSIFVLPSYAEGLPIAILEGMAAGNAIVSTTVGSIPEVISEDRGRVIEAGAPGTLTSTLESLCTANGTVREMAEANCTAIREQYNWEKVSSELMDIYGEVAGRAPA